MRGVILAAGRGRRMGTLTDDRPKCFTVLEGRSLLDWQLAGLRGAGAGEVAVVTGYAAHVFEGIGDRRFHNPRWAETQMVRSLECAAPWLETGPTLVSYSDILYEPETASALASHPGDIVISYHPAWRRLWELRFADPLADAETFETGADGRLIAIGERASSMDQIRGQYMGLLKFTPAGWATVTALLGGLEPLVHDKVDMTSLLGRLLRAGVRIDTVPARGLWLEVDTESDFRLYERLLADGFRLD